MISGQAATPQTRNDCQTYADFVLASITPDGQAVGSGCVYPAQIKTLADQLRSKGKTWRAYFRHAGHPGVTTLLPLARAGGFMLLCEALSVQGYAHQTEYARAEQEQAGRLGGLGCGGYCNAQWDAQPRDQRAFTWPRDGVLAY